MDPLDGLRIESALAAAVEREEAEDEVGQNDFLTMLVAQLENQDPLNPQDSADFAAQLAQFSSVEQLVAMRAGIDELVAAAGSAGASGGAIGSAGAIDPTNLVGKNVTVYGNTIQIDESTTSLALDYRTISEATDAQITIRDAEGRVVHQESLVPPGDGGLPGSLRPGDHVYTVDPRDLGLPNGNYAVELTGQDAAGEAVTLLPMVSGLVTGAILAGEPSIRLADGRIFRVEDVLEVSSVGATGRGGQAIGAPVATGGGLGRVDPTPGLAPTQVGPTGGGLESQRAGLIAAPTRTAP